MKTAIRRALAWGLLAALVGCSGGGSSSNNSSAGSGGGGGGGGTFRTAVQGDWKVCENNAPDEGLALTLSGTSVTAKRYEFTTTDGTCGGTGTLFTTLTGTVAYGFAVTATLNGSPVSATAIDWTMGTQPTEYEIGYVDSNGRLYNGDAGATPGLDDSTPAKRPTVLDPVSFMVRGTFTNVTTGGGGGGGAVQATCNSPSIGMCNTFSGYTAADLASVSSGACFAGTWSTSVLTCPATNSVGVCSQTWGGPEAEATTFYSPTWTAASASAGCVGGGGTWTP